MRSISKLPLIFLTLSLGLCSALADGSTGAGPSKPMSSSSSGNASSSVSSSVTTALGL